MEGFLNLIKPDILNLGGGFSCIHKPYPYSLNQLNYIGEDTSILGTPWKINMEPTNHQFRKENDLPNLHDYVPY